jgi:hypothetical protein
MSDWNIKCVGRLTTCVAALSFHEANADPSFLANHSRTVYRLAARKGPDAAGGGVAREQRPSLRVVHDSDDPVSCTQLCIASLSAMASMLTGREVDSMRTMITQPISK